MTASSVVAAHDHRSRLLPRRRAHLRSTSDGVTHAFARPVRILEHDLGWMNDGPGWRSICEAVSILRVRDGGEPTGSLCKACFPTSAAQPEVFRDDLALACPDE